MIWGTGCKTTEKMWCPQVSIYFFLRTKNQNEKNKTGYQTEETKTEGIVHW